MNWGDFFYFHKSDRIAMIAIGIVILVLVVVFFSPNNGGTSAFFTLPVTDSLSRSAGGAEKSPSEYYYVEGEKVILSPFDPNTADSTQLLSLGLQPWMVRNIYRYRAAGGVYRRAEDFSRLYGLTKKQYEMLRPYIRISDDYRAASDFYGDVSVSQGHALTFNEEAKPLRDTVKYPRKLLPGEKISLNSSDTSELKKVPGIGSAYALAIVRRRDRLGGFYSERQLLEIDGLPEQALSYFLVDGHVKRLNINRLTYSQLRQHPYFNYYQARDIVDFRRLHGPLKSLSQLKLLKSFTAEDLERLQHYVEF